MSFEWARESLSYQWASGAERTVSATINLHKRSFSKGALVQLIQRTENVPFRANLSQAKDGSETAPRAAGFGALRTMIDLGPSCSY
jgi:hypothetical protein